MMIPVQVKLIQETIDQMISRH